MTSGIYKISNTISGKVYIGSAVNLQLRWKEHRTTLRCGRHKNRKMQASYLKHGDGSFKYEIIELCEPSRLIEREQHWIDTLCAVECGFNLNPVAGSALGRKFPFKRLTADHRAKIGASKKGKRRKPFSAKWRRKLSLVAKRPRPNQSAAMLRIWASRKAAA